MKTCYFAWLNINFRHQCFTEVGNVSCMLIDFKSNKAR